MNTSELLTDFSNFIAESINIINGELVIDWNSKDGQKSSFGKSTKKKKFVPYNSNQKKFKGTSIYSVYQLDSKIGTEVLKRIKKDKNFKEYQEFITRTAIYICSSTSGMLNNVDIILSPNTSSEFNEDILNEIKKRKPGIEIIKESFQKANISDIKIDYSDFPNVSDKTKSAMETILAKAKKNGHLEVKKYPKCS